MRKMITKLLSILLVFCMVVQYAPAALAVTMDDVRAHTETAAPETELPDNDELFAMYVEQALYGSQWTTFGTAARENLNAVEQALYDALKPEIETVAANGGSTAFVLSDVSGLKIEWTSEELGVESIEDLTAVREQFAAQFSLEKVLSALLCDCPFDLYWYDKTEGTGMSYGISRSGQTVDGTTRWTRATISNLTFTFQVASGYHSGDTATVTADVAKVSTARTKAQSIVDTYGAGTEYEKLTAYKAEICGLVSYNDAAAEDDYTGGYGDPWQLIYVFDGDAGTGVVCEGYAKAFQYLCDLGGLSCISVTGQMTGGTGAGGHMWNIVTLDGENYLVDVTNCDEGTVGAPDALFLVGNADGSVAGGYAFSLGSQTISFAYDDDTLSTWTEGQLTLAASDYEPAADGCAHVFADGACTLCGAVCGHEGFDNGFCTLCGMGSVVNTAAGVHYGTVTEALTAAGEGETVRLLTDCAESQIMVYPGVTLDLNGHMLTADYVAGFDTAHVVDAAGGGRLVTGLKSVVLDEENDMVPVYDGTGYIFTKAGFAVRQDSAYTGDGIRINALAYPVNMDVVELLKDGGADNNLRVMVLLRWDTDEGTGSQKFVFTDDVVAEVYSSNNGTFSGYSKMFSMTITGFENIENLKANVVVVSDTNVEYASSTSLSITE